VEYDNKVKNSKLQSKADNKIVTVTVGDEQRGVREGKERIKDVNQSERLTKLIQILLSRSRDREHRIF
jgi:hypothetical protein